ncbi:MAG TPA: class A beta-lactamase [Gemmatimonadales bacterium]
MAVRWRQRIGTLGIVIAAGAMAAARIEGQVPHRLARSGSAIGKIAAAIDGRVGAAGLVVETGDRVDFRGNERFPMQSVYKVPIAMAVLQQIDAGRVTLSQSMHLRRGDLVPEVHSPIRDANPSGGDFTVRELLRGAIVESDGTASDMLLTMTTPENVTHLLRTAGIDSVVVATTERAMTRGPTVQDRNWSTPRAAVQLLRELQRGRTISAPSRALLLGWMEETTIGADRIKGRLPKGTIVAHKTGLDQTRNGMVRATNDIGLVTLPNGQHLAIAVFIRDSRAPESRRADAIARIARAMWDAATARR